MIGRMVYAFAIDEKDAEEAVIMAEQRGHLATIVPPIGSNDKPDME